MSRVGGQSEPDLAAAVRREARAASEAASSVRSGHRRRHRHGGSEADLHSTYSGSRSYASRSRGSRSVASSYYQPMTMTLEEQQKHVQEQAMARHLAEVEKEAKQAVIESKKWTMTVQGGKDEERNDIENRRNKFKKNQEGVMEQMEANKAKRANARREYIEAASSHSFPLFTETFIDEEEYERIRKRQKELWREELNQQLTTTKMLRNIEEKKKNDHAKKKCADGLAAMTKDRGIEIARLANQGRELVNSWDRDIKLKTLKKQIALGNDVVQDVNDHGTRTVKGYMPR